MYKAIFLFVVLAISCLSLIYFSTAARSTDEPTLTVKLPDGLELQELNPDGPPPLYQFLEESDFVVIASSTGKKPVGKRDKKANDMADWLVGAVDTFQVEELLYSKRYDPKQSIHKSRSFDMFRLNDVKSTVKQGNRYLLFVKEIPTSEDIFLNLELDRGKTYYRIFNGSQSIFTTPPNPFHGTNNQGRINLSRGEHLKLVETIKQFSAALGETDRVEKRRKLNAMTESKNEVLRDNAKYAIKVLSLEDNDSGLRL